MVTTGCHKIFQYGFLREGIIGPSKKKINGADLNKFYNDNLKCVVLIDSIKALYITGYSSFTCCMTHYNYTKWTIKF
jgi:hypothetical protein